MILNKLFEREIPWQSIENKYWQFSKIKHHYEIILGKMLQNEAQSTEDAEVPYLKAQHVQSDRVLIDNELPTMWASPLEIATLKVRKYDLLVCEGGEIGRAAIISNDPPENCIIQNSLHLVRSTPTADVKFLKYLLQHAISHGWLDVLCNKATITHFTVDKFSQISIWLPPLVEQKAIARYLDRQTAKIDELIKIKKRLLELLDEKRRALIIHAVTRGLNSDVALHDSGVEWIGQIPKHWEVIRLRRCILTLEQGWSPQADEKEPEDQEWGVLKLNAVKRGQFDDSKAKTIPISLEIPTALEIHQGDFLITRANTPELVGDVCYVHKTRPQLILSYLIYRLRLDESKLHGQFLSFFLQTPIGRLQIEADARGSSSSMVIISQGHILNSLLLLPPLKEQESIVDYIEAKLSQVNALKTATEHTIKLLEERRTALITAAVTGQIKIKE